MPSDARPPESIIGGRYEVVELLGRGGMGDVYAVVERSSGRSLALKQLRAHTGSKEKALFEREYRTLAGLRHRSIVEVFEYGVEAGVPHYTMELLQGTDLTGKAPLPWREVCACLREAASVLGVLHARRVVHRDLSSKNLWRTPDGGIKLIDFGALTPFGEAAAVVGTPPFVAPEAALERIVDQRTDLFALGALGYWLLTRTHAYPAEKLMDLPRAWQTSPPAPSRRLRSRGVAEDAPPEELDRLILSLLQREASARPAGTTEVIDSLNDIADLAPEAHDVVAQGYMESRAFVGRQAALTPFEVALSRAQSGGPQSLFVEGPEGIGRSRLQRELATLARVAGALVLDSNTTAVAGPYGVAIDLAVQLLTSAPQDASECVEPHLAVVARLSERLRLALQRLGVEMPNAVRQDRARIQHALAEWLLAVSRRRLLVVLVDDVHAIDEESQALLAALSSASGGCRLLTAVTACVPPGAVEPPAVRSVRSRARDIELPPLTEEETLELLRSLFGDVPYLERVAGALHGRSRGNPRYCLLLAEHLVRTRAARYADGTWSLPADVPEAGLPTSLRAAVLAGLERLGPEARVLASRLSVADRGPLTREMCVALSSQDEADALSTLSELFASGVVEESGSGIRFAHPALRGALTQELTREQLATVHGSLGALLERNADANLTVGLRAALHWLRAGETRRGARLLQRTARSLITVISTDLRDRAPLMAEAVDALSAAGYPDADLLEPLTVLAVCGYFVDLQYARRYGERAVLALQRSLHLDWAERITGWAGPRVALWMAFARAGAEVARLRGASTVPQRVHCLVATCTSLTGVSATCFDTSRAHLFTQALAPLTALGEDHVASILYRFCEALRSTAQDRPSRPYQLSKAVIQRLEDATPIPGLAEGVRRDYLAGAYFVHGMFCVFRSDDSALSIAAELERRGPLYELNAEHLRTLHYASRGDLERSAQCRRRLGVRAIQVGSAWRMDAIAPALIMPAFWAADAVAMKRTVDQLERLAQSAPSMRAHHEAARAAYWLLRGKPGRAVELLDAYPERSIPVAGWSRTRGLLACGLNLLEDHVRAREICREALSQLSEEDLEFVGMNVVLQVELSLAEASLGEASGAAMRLDQLIAQHEPRQAPLLLAYLHRARTRVGLIAHDTYSARHHVDAMAEWTRRTRLPSLTNQLQVLKAEVQKAQHPEGHREALPHRPGAPFEGGTQLLLSTSDALDADEARRALRVAVELASADHGFFVFLSPDAENVHLGSSPPDEALVRWVLDCLTLEPDGQQTAVEGGSEPSQEDGLGRFAGFVYALTPVWETSGTRELPMAALVLGYQREPEQPLASGILRLISDHLSEGAGHSDRDADSDPS